MKGVGLGELAIETTGLRKEFGRKVAVQDLSVTVSQGEIFGFLGPNGAGKTTSLKMLLGLLHPTSGQANVLGAPLGTQQARAKMGFLPEHFRFHDWLSGRELLEFHGKLFGLNGSKLERRSQELLERVDMVEAADRKLREYSKGMLQRIGLAQALLNEPKLVFLDEPTSGLDPLGRFLVRDVMRELKHQGTTVFLNSHLLSEVEQTCDRVVFVKEGRIVHELQLSESARAFDVELRLDAADSDVLDGLSQFGSDAREEHGIVHVRVSDEEKLPQIARWLISKNVDLYRMQAARRSLESVFLEVMGDDQRPG